MNQMILIGEEQPQGYFILYYFLEKLMWCFALTIFLSRGAFQSSIITGHIKHKNYISTMQSLEQQQQQKSMSEKSLSQVA